MELIFINCRRLGKYCSKKEVSSSSITKTSYHIVDAESVPMCRRGFVTVPPHTVEWFAVFGVPMSSTFANIMVDNTFDHEVLRKGFVLLFILFVLLRSNALYLTSFGFSF